MKKVVTRSKRGSLTSKMRYVHLGNTDDYWHLWSFWLNLILMAIDRFGSCIDEWLVTCHVDSYCRLLLRHA